MTLLALKGHFGSRPCPAAQAETMGRDHTSVRAPRRVYAG